MDERELFEQECEAQLDIIGFDDDFDDLPYAIARCAECDELIYDADEVWIDEDGFRFCSAECACHFHGIVKGDD